jgi:hypothetical protein
VTDDVQRAHDGFAHRCSGTSVRDGPRAHDGDVSVVGGVYGDLELVPLAPIEMHPAAHALHYGSTCFEG